MKFRGGVKWNRGRGVPRESCSPVGEGALPDGGFNGAELARRRAARDRDAAVSAAPSHPGRRLPHRAGAAASGSASRTDQAPRASRRPDILPARPPRQCRSTSIISFSPLPLTDIMMPSPMAITTPITTPMTVHVVPRVSRTPIFQSAPKSPAHEVRSRGDTSRSILCRLRSRVGPSVHPPSIPLRRSSGRKMRPQEGSVITAFVTLERNGRPVDSCCRDLSSYGRQLTGTR